MNVWAVAILVALLLELSLGLAADWLNLRALTSTVPAELRDLYDPERYRRAQAYARARTRFGIVTSVVDLALLLGFWFAGGFDGLDQAVRALELGPVATGLIFFAALGLAHQLLRLPVRWWSTFVIEARFGFNRTSPRTFWADAAKGALLAALVGAPLLAAILWIFELSGKSFGGCMMRLNPLTPGLEKFMSFPRSPYRLPSRWDGHECPRLICR